MTPAYAKYVTRVRPPPPPPPILFDNSMLSFSQYELKSSEATRFRGSMLMRFKSLEPPQFLLHASQFAFKSVGK